jgi:AbrB family looped-hinge helix DNA binding protein
MKDVSTTKLSSRGQVVIPEEIRRRMRLEPGTQFVVVGEGDVVILKAIQAPSMEQFDALVERARATARESGMSPRDVEEAIEKVRGSR